MLGELAKLLKRQPGESLGVAVSAASPSRSPWPRARGCSPTSAGAPPWPLVAQLPLAWLACAMELALLHLLGEAIQPRELQQVVPYLAAAVPMLLVGMRLCDPLEARLASRWVLLTGGRD